MLATTTEVRRIVRETIGISMTYCDKAKDPKVRLLSTMLPWSTGAYKVAMVIKALQAEGYDNHVSITGCGQKYLRIRAAYPNG